MCNYYDQRVKCPGCANNMGSLPLVSIACYEANGKFGSCPALEGKTAGVIMGNVTSLAICAECQRRIQK